jgi:glycosyltransferase involved in cell wall biosynthesis
MARTGKSKTENNPGQEPQGGVDVIVPVLNEREMLPGFLARIQALGLPFNLIFIDNGSLDGTVEFLASRPDITVIAHGQNLGYGRSLADGLSASRADRVIIIDADGEYPPEAIPRLLKGLEQAPVVYGSRFLSGGKIDMSRTRILGNRCLTGLFNRLYGQRLTDLYTGLKALRRPAFQGLSFNRSGFDQVVELAAKLAHRKISLAEIPVDYMPRKTGRSKMKHIPELLKAVYCLVAFRVIRNE